MLHLQQFEKEWNEKLRAYKEGLEELEKFSNRQQYLFETLHPGSPVMVKLKKHMAKMGHQKGQNQIVNQKQDEVQYEA